MLLIPQASSGAFTRSRMPQKQIAVAIAIAHPRRMNLDAALAPKTMHHH